jgi:hypothetical protein
LKKKSKGVNSCYKEKKVDVYPEKRQLNYTVVVIDVEVSEQL